VTFGTHASVVTFTDFPLKKQTKNRLEQFWSQFLSKTGIRARTCAKNDCQLLHLHICTSAHQMNGGPAATHNQMIKLCVVASMQVRGPSQQLVAFAQVKASKTGATEKQRCLLLW
jgi:hypothetical protein